MCSTNGAPYKGPIPGRRQGVLISMEDGTAVAFALWNLEDRGKMFIQRRKTRCYQAWSLANIAATTIWK